jgi:uncharacterized repeat protein (TIGR03806 family)
MALPDGTTITVNSDGAFDFPIGTVLVKNFAFADKLIETRLLVRHKDGAWGGYSYEWNEDHSDAILVPPAGKSKPISGIVEGQVWRYPSHIQCFQCHTEEAGISLGPELAQLNGDMLYPSTGRIANQLLTLEQIGMFQDVLPPVEQLPRLPHYYDLSTPVNLRARGYLHANCAMCHRPAGPGEGPENFLYFVSDQEMNALNVLPTQGSFDIPDARLIYPGQPERSVTLHRMNILEPGRMPPIGTSVVDQQGVDLVTAWILSLKDPATDVPPGTPGTLQFSGTTYSVPEGGVSAIITVTRVGGSFGAVGVDYASTDGSATGGSDYTAVSGSLSFAEGVTTQSFSIDILDDAANEGNETLNLILSNPTGGAALGSPSTSSLVIVGDDAPTDDGSTGESRSGSIGSSSASVVEDGVQTDDGSTGGSSGGSIDLITLILLFSLYLGNFRRKIIC